MRRTTTASAAPSPSAAAMSRSVRERWISALAASSTFALSAGCAFALCLTSGRCGAEPDAAASAVAAATLAAVASAAPGSRSPNATSSTHSSTITKFSGMEMSVKPPSA